MKMCRSCSPANPITLCPTAGPLFRSATNDAGARAAASTTTNVTAAPITEIAGASGRRVLLKGGMVLSMDSNVGNFAKGDILIEGAKIVAVGANIEAGDAHVIDASGKIVMPGPVDPDRLLYHELKPGAFAATSGKMRRV